jgi:hypothetical protein
VATIAQYDTVLQALLGQGLKCLYHNSGAFDFPPDVDTFTLGCIGRPDSTIRPEAVAFTRQIEPPYVQNLARLALGVWREQTAGVLWVMPRSHWAYELDFGSRHWMSAALERIGIDSKILTPLTTGAAIAFKNEEIDEFGSFLTALLDNLSGSSDFQLAWPGKPLLCTVHHHKQLWWTTPEEAIYRGIEHLI